MANAQLVNVGDTRDELLEILAGHFLFKPLILDNEIEELAALHELHDQIQILLCLNYFINLYHIWVMELFKDLYFPGYSLNILFILYSGLFEYFHGDLQNKISIILSLKFLSE